MNVNILSQDGKIFGNFDTVRIERYRDSSSPEGYFYNIKGCTKSGEDNVILGVYDQEQSARNVVLAIAMLDDQIKRSEFMKENYVHGRSFFSMPSNDF